MPVFAIGIRAGCLDTADPTVRARRRLYRQPFDPQERPSASDPLLDALSDLPRARLRGRRPARARRLMTSAPSERGAGVCRAARHPVRAWVFSRHRWRPRPPSSRHTGRLRTSSGGSVATNSDQRHPVAAIHDDPTDDGCNGHGDDERMPRPTAPSQLARSAIAARTRCTIISGTRNSIRRVTRMTRQPASSRRA